MKRNTLELFPSKKKQKGEAKTHEEQFLKLRTFKLLVNFIFIKKVANKQKNTEQCRETDMSNTDLCAK